jgi:integrase
MDEMRPQGLLERENGFYFQARIPKRYATHYPSVILREKLPTDSRREAIALVHKRHALLHEEYARIDETGSRFKSIPMQDEADMLIKLAIHSRLTADDEIRGAGVDDFTYARMSASHAEAEATERVAVARGQLTPTAIMIVEDWLRGHGYDVDSQSPAFREFALKFIKAQAEATKAVKLRHEGVPVDTPEKPLEAAGTQRPASRSNTPLLSEVIKGFLDDYAHAKPMYKKHQAVLPMFLELVGDRTVNELRQLDIDEFFKLICRLPPRWSDQVRRRKVSIRELAQEDHSATMSPKTFEDTYIASVRPFLSKAKRLYGDVGFPHTLTAEGIEYRGNQKEGANKQRAFTPEEIRRLVEGPVLRSFASDPSSQHMYWLPLVGLFTGARINEICQVNPQVDIGDEEGIWFFNFTNETEGDARINKTIKNESSVRLVPIHPKLIELGFLDYCKRLKESGSKLLFPAFEPYAGANRKASGRAMKWFDSLLRELGLRDETPGKRIAGSHVFRHTFLHTAMNLGVEGAEKITGHAGQDSQVVRGYKGDLWLTNRLKIVEGIQYEAVFPVPCGLP